MLLAEQLVGEARQRRATRPSARERHVMAASAITFLAVATMCALWLPADGSVDPVAAAILVVGYAVASRVRFEFGGWFVSTEQLFYIPALFLLPLPLVPAFVGLANVVAMVPDVVRGEWHRDRLAGCFPDSWWCVGPVLVLGLFAHGQVDLDLWPIYIAAMATQILFDLTWGLLRNALLDHIPVDELIKSFIGTARVDVILSPVALMVAVGASQQTLALLAIFPLIWLLESFSRDRKARYASALELNRAYRGTVTLLADVVEFDDPYTAAHSRSIVDLVEATAEKLGINSEKRQELEFAALLHDVGKIAIPKEILNKPAALTDDEYELMKTHTVEGQFMLDRVGGFLGRIGEVVRSCHERWDGKGYPDGLAGEEIPFAARLVFCCDAYNAMTTDRVYRQALSMEAAIAELERNSGTQFDPSIVPVLIEVVQEGEPAVAGNDEIRAILARTPVEPLNARV